METKRMMEYLFNIHAVRYGIYRPQENGTAECVAAMPRETPRAPDKILSLAAKAQEAQAPLLASVQGAEYYALIPDQDSVLIMGPVTLSAKVDLKYNFEDEEVSESFGNNPMLDVPVAVELIKMLAEQCMHRAWTQDELFELNWKQTSAEDVKKQFSDQVYENRENSNFHNAYSQEVRMLSSIERGDLEMLAKAQQEESSGTLGKMAPTAERSARNVCISVITLLSRAAIRGGVHPEIAFTMCDSYAMKIETMQNLVELSSLMHGAQNHFATMVHVINQGKSKASDHEVAKVKHPQVERCKNYVYNHLHGRVSLGDAAEALGISPKYLSTLFKRTEGIAFCDFVIREKIEVAKQLLLYSQLSYSEIAATLGFATQSHMGKCFREWTGMTPIQYQKQHAVTEL